MEENLENCNLFPWRRSFWLATFATFFIFASLSAVFTPTFSLFALELGATPLEIGFLFGLPLVMGLFFRIPGSTLSTLIGRKGILLFSAMICFFAPFLLYFFQNLTLLYAVGAIYGLATLVPSVALSFVHDVLPKEKKSEYMGYFSMGGGMGRVVGAIGAGFLIETLKSYPLVFLCAAFSAGIGVLFFMCLPSIGLGVQKPQNLSSQFFQDLKNTFEKKSLRHLGWIRSFQGMASATTHSYFPLFASSILGFGASQIGLIQGGQVFFSLLSRSLTGYWLKGRNSSHLLIFSFLGLALFLFFIPLFNQFIILLVIFAGMGFLEGVCYLSTLTQASKVSGNRLFGTTAGWLGTMNDVGMLGGRLLPGLVLIFPGGFVLAFSLVAGGLGLFGFSTLSMQFSKPISEKKLAYS